MFQKYFYCKSESNDFCSGKNNIDILDRKNKSKYVSYFSFFHKFYSQVQLDVLHKPEIEPEQVFIHTRDGEEVEVRSHYYLPMIQISIIFSILGCLHHPRLPRALQGGVV